MQILVLGHCHNFVSLEPNVIEGLDKDVRIIARCRIQVGACSGDYTVCT
jgi:hypothetical protein